MNYNFLNHKFIMDINKLSKDKLLEKCTELNITKCKSKNKSQLILLINDKLNDKITSIVEYKPYSFIEVCSGGG